MVIKNKLGVKALKMLNQKFKLMLMFSIMSIYTQIINFHQNNHQKGIKRPIIKCENKMKIITCVEQRQFQALKINKMFFTKTIIK